MTKDEMERQVSNLLLEQRRLKRLDLELPPNKLSLLERLLYRLGWTKMSRTKPIKYARLTLGAPRLRTSFGGEPVHEHDLHDETGSVVGNIKLRNRGHILHVDWVGGTGTNAGSNLLGNEAMRSVHDALAHHYPNAQYLSGHRISGFRGTPSRVMVPIRRKVNMSRTPKKYGTTTTSVTTPNTNRTFSPVSHTTGPSRIGEDLRLFRKHIRSTHATSPRGGISPNSSQEKSLLHDFAKNRGLKVARSQYTYYDEPSHTFYHPNPENKVAVADAYIKHGTGNVHFSRTKPKRYAKFNVATPSHPLVQGFPIEHVLRHLANDPKNEGNIRDLSVAALRGHTEALWGLHDALQEHDEGKGHPILKAGYKWLNAADKLHLDKHTYTALSEAAQRRRAEEPHAAHQVHKDQYLWQYTPEHQAINAVQGIEATGSQRQGELASTIHSRVKQLSPHSTDDEIFESMRRHAHRATQESQRRVTGNSPDSEKGYALNAVRDNPASIPMFQKNEEATRYKRRPIDHKKLIGVGKFLSKNGAMPGYGQIFVKGSHIWYVGGDGDEWPEKGNYPEKKFKEVPGVTKVTYEAEAFPEEEGWIRVGNKITDGIGKKKYSLANKSNFIGALLKSSSPEHKMFVQRTKELAKRAGAQQTREYPALHDTPNQSVPGVAMALYGHIQPDSAHALGSWVNGLLPNSPGYAVFHARPTGPDTLYRIRMDGSGYDARVKLDRAGISSRVFVPHKKGLDVLIPDKGNTMGQAVEQFASQQKVPIESSPGHLTTVGSQDQAQARSTFRNKIAKVRMSRSKPKRYSGETTEEDFHRQLDANPNDHQTRMVFADWLQERNDPRAEGYRALGQLQRVARHFRPPLHDPHPTYQETHTWGTVNNHHYPDEENSLPHDWFSGIQPTHVVPEYNSQSEQEWWKHHNTRREADDQAALGFSRLPEEHKHEILNPQPTQLSRRQSVKRYAITVTKPGGLVRPKREPNPFEDVSAPKLPLAPPKKVKEKVWNPTIVPPKSKPLFSMSEYNRLHNWAHNHAFTHTPAFAKFLGAKNRRDPEVHNMLAHAIVQAAHEMRRGGKNSVVVGLPNNKRIKINIPRSSWVNAKLGGKVYNPPKVKEPVKHQELDEQPDRELMSRSKYGRRRRILNGSKR